MVCIYCASPTKVTNSRLQRRANHIWRRRNCVSCGSIFTSIEQAELSTSIMVNTTRHKDPVPFVRDILFVSIYESCKHRTDAVDDASAITDIVVGQLLAGCKDGLLTRNQITTTAHLALSRFDQVAATFYRAYHPSARNAAA